MLNDMIVVIVNVIIFVGLIFLLSKILYQQKIKKYNINNYSFWVEKATTGTFKSSDRIFMPEFVIYCQFTFSYKNCNYTLKIDVDRIYNQLVGNSWFHGYDTMNNVLALDNKKRLFYYKDDVFKAIQRHIYDIELLNMKEKIDNQLLNRE